MSRNCERRWKTEKKQQAPFRFSFHSIFHIVLLQISTAESYFGFKLCSENEGKSCIKFITSYCFFSLNLFERKLAFYQVFRWWACWVLLISSVSVVFLQFCRWTKNKILFSYFHGTALVFQRKLCCGEQRHIRRTIDLIKQNCKNKCSTTLFWCLRKITYMYTGGIWGKEKKHNNNFQLVRLRGALWMAREIESNRRMAWKKKKVTIIIELDITLAK